MIPLHLGHLSGLEQVLFWSLILGPCVALGLVAIFRRG